MLLRPGRMLFREFLLPIDTILILTIFLQPHIHSILYKSSDVHFNCSSLFHRTVYESYLLSEGDGLILGCNVCSECFKGKEMCELGVVKSGLLIPRVETTSIQSHYANDTNLFVPPYPTSLERIRLRYVLLTSYFLFRLQIEKSFPVAAVFLFYKIICKLVFHTNLANK